MDIEELKKERMQLLNRVRIIEKQLNLQVTKLELDEIRDVVKKATGIDVKNIGLRGDKETRLAKQMFWRAAFLYSYSGTVLSEYCGMNSRFAALAGRNLYVKKCKKDKSLDFDWKTFKQKL